MLFITGVGGDGCSYGNSSVGAGGGGGYYGGGAGYGLHFITSIILSLNLVLSLTILSIKY